jgi:hypothetical protein
VRAIGAVAVVLVVIGLAHLVSARRALDLARSHLRAARQGMAEGNRAAASDDLDQAAAELHSASRSAGAFPLAILRPVPLLGSPSRAVGATAEAGLQGVAAGRAAVDALSAFPTAGGQQMRSDDLGAMHDAAEGGQRQLALASRHLGAADRSLSGPAGASLPQISGPARSIRDDLGQSRRSLASAQRGLALMTQLTAPDADLRILLLFQDTLELRPTGGYVGTVGILHLSHGRMTLEQHQASEDLPAPDPPIAPPEDLAPVLPGAWGVSNANWWPDFPTSARMAAELYARQGGGQVDGVLALTENTTRRLLDVLGPVNVPGYAEPVASDGFEDRVVHEVELKRPLDTPRKKFLTELAGVLFDRVTHVPAGELPAVARALDRSTAAGDIQVWFADPARQATLSGTVVAGQLPHTTGDFLMMVDANLSASKANEGLVKHATYRVRSASHGRVQARLQVVVQNKAPESAVNPYYNGFLRVYAPAQARLLGDRPDQGDEGVAASAPYRVFTQLLDVDPTRTQTVTFDYVLPSEVAPSGHYRLLWMRQAGTPNDSLDAVVGGRTVPVPADGRELRASTTFRGSLGHQITAWFRDRWVVRRLGL